MTAEEPGYEDLIKNEWDSMDAQKALYLRMELQDWKKNREATGYDVRLIEGAIAVCDAYLLALVPVPGT